jgi:cytochrome c6
MTDFSGGIVAKMRVTALRLAVLATLVTVIVLWGTTAAAQDAAANYKAKCAMCHGADGKGDTPIGKKMGIHDFASAEVQKASDADLIATITKGKNKMPAYENKLNAAQIKEIVAFIRSLAKGK